MKVIDFSHIPGVGVVGNKARKAMVNALNINNKTIREVITNTPRHFFLSDALAKHAYSNIALPIGFGQTISQPEVVAHMSEALFENSKNHKAVLEVGTGCGYQSAILAQLFNQVYTIERIEGLYKNSKKRLKALKLNNVHCYLSDGANLINKQKFDAIIITAAAEKIPQHFINLLAKEGCLIAPEGSQQANYQYLVKITFDGKKYQRNNISAVNFVPLLSGIKH